MIDKIKIGKYIDKDNGLDRSKFSKRMKLQQKDDLVNYETGEIYSIDRYICKINNNITVIYSNKTNRITIEGRLININYIRNKIYNYDDYIRPRYKAEYEYQVRTRSDSELGETAYYDKDDKLCFLDREEEIIVEDVFENHSIEEIINNLNKEINVLLGTREVTEEIKSFKNGDLTYKTKIFNINDMLDIRDFRVMNIEICFNIWLKRNYVSKYIELFNLIFKDKEDKRYRNYTLETNKGIGTSYYVKPAAQMRDNIKSSYVMNFYDKYNQLKYLEDDGYSIAIEEYKRAERLLRLEIQLYYSEIKNICNKYKLVNKFSSFLDLDLCLNLLKDKYNRFIGDYKLDFYNYHKAKDKIENTLMLGDRNKENLLNYLREKYQYNKKHSDTTVRKYNKMLHRLKIHDYFIPASFNIEFMKSPIRLLNQKLNYYHMLNKRHTKKGYPISDGEYYSY